MGPLFNSRSAAASSWLLMSLALLILQVQAQHSRYGSRQHYLRRIGEISHSFSKMQHASPSLLHPVSVPLISAPILKLPPPPKKFAHAAIAPIPTKDDPNDQVNGFIQLVKDNYPLYPPAPYHKPTVPPKTAPPTTEPATTVPPTTTVKPTTVKIYVRPTRPYVRPPPPTAKPVTTRKPFVFKTLKPTKRPFNIVQKITKATPAPTASAASPTVSAAPSTAVASHSEAPELSPIGDVRVHGGEMMKLGVTKAIEPATITDDATAPATISTAAPAAVPPATTAPAPVSTNAPATKPPVQESTTIPLSFSTYRPRPVYRPAIYTRPPFRPHRQYTILPKSTKADEPLEDEKSIVDVRVSLPTTTEVVPEIVTVKEDSLEPAPFDDYEIDMEIGKLIPNSPQGNLIPDVNEEPGSSESTELPAVIPEDVPTIQDPAEPIVFEDTEDIETIPEQPKLIADPSVPFVIGDANFESEILESLPEEPKVIETNPVDPIVEDYPEIEIITEAPEIPQISPEIPKILDIPDESEIFVAVQEEQENPEFSPAVPENVEGIPFETEILDTIPEAPQFIKDIPVDLMVDDPVSDEINIAESIPEIPISFEDVPNNFDVIEPELLEPQVEEEEKLLPIANIELFDPIFSDPANDIRLSIEETETTESPEADLEISNISEDIDNVVPVAAEVPKSIDDVLQPELVEQESPENLQAFEVISGLEEEGGELAPITEVTEAELLLKKVEPQPFKRSHKYEPVWNIHSFGHGNKNSQPKSQSFPGWPELSSTTRKSLDYPTWLQSTTISPNARIVPDWPQDITTRRGYVYSKWSPQLKNGKETKADNSDSEEALNSHIKTVENSSKKTTKQNIRLNRIKGVRPSRVRPGRRRTSTVKPTTRRGTLPESLTETKSTTVKPPTSSTLFPTWEEIQTRKASRERTSSESKENNSGFDTGFGTGFDFGDWGGKI